MVKSTLGAHQTKDKPDPLARRTKDSDMTVMASSYFPCRMIYQCSTCDYISELYFEMCTHVLWVHFQEKVVPFKCQVCRVCKVTQGAFHTHHKKKYWE